MTACDLRSGFGLCGVNERSEAMLTSFSFARIHRELDERDRGHPSGRHRKTSFAASRPWMIDCSGDRAPSDSRRGRSSLASRSWRIDPRRCWTPVRASSQDVVRGFAAVDDRLLRRPGTVR